MASLLPRRSLFFFPSPASSSPLPTLWYSENCENFRSYLLNLHSYRAVPGVPFCASPRLASPLIWNPWVLFVALLLPAPVVILENLHHVRSTVRSFLLPESFLHRHISHLFILRLTPHPRVCVHVCFSVSLFLSLSLSHFSFKIMATLFRSQPLWLFVHVYNFSTWRGCGRRIGSRLTWAA